MNPFTLKHPLPRARRNSTGGTAEAAAAHMAEGRKDVPLRKLILDLVEERPAMGEEMLARLRARGIRTVLYSVKPRFSELKRQGLVADSGERGVSESGKLRSVRWRATTPEERAEWAARQAEGADHE